MNFYQKPGFACIFIGYKFLSKQQNLMYFEQSGQQTDRSKDGQMDRQTT